MLKVMAETFERPTIRSKTDWVDLEKRRLFVAAVANGTLEVLDLGAGTVINSIAGIKDAQDAADRDELIRANLLPPDGSPCAPDHRCRSDRCWSWPNRFPYRWAAVLRLSRAAAVRIMPDWQ